MDSFAISPASARPLWFLALIIVVLGAILLAMAYTAYSSRHSRVDIRADQIRIAGDFWGRRIPLDQLDLDHAREVDLRRDHEFAPARRTLGTGLPGYQSGWFRLKNGEKALLYLTCRDQVVYIPTTLGYSLLLSVAEPGRFLARLEASGD